MKTSFAFAIFTVLHAYVQGQGSLPPQTPQSRYGTISFQQNGNVTRATFNNPPINLVDYKLVSDLYDFLQHTQPASGRTTPKVVIFDSSNPNFFLSHFDLHTIEEPITTAKTALFNQLIDCSRFLQNITSTAFIAEINGRTIGAGQELSIQMDMRFAGPNALASSFENSIGLVAAAGGQPFLGPTIGKARALEYLLASKAFDAATGTALGLFNSYFDSQESLTTAVNALAARIGFFPQHSLNDTKFTLSYLNPSVQMLNDQIGRFLPLEMDPADQAIVQEFVALSDNQTESSFELGIPESIFQAYYRS